MNVNGFGSFLPFEEIPPGTLFLDQSLGVVTDTAILFKVADPEQRLNCIRIFDRHLIERGQQMPSVTPPLPPDRPVLALPDFLIEIESRIDNVAWESDVDFTRAAVMANSRGELSVKAYRNRDRDDYDFLLFHLTDGDHASLPAIAVGFRRWSIVRRASQSERLELFRFDL
jgi:hypothetical protein